MTDRELIEAALAAAREAGMPDASTFANVVVARARQSVVRWRYDGVPIPATVRQKLEHFLALSPAQRRRYLDAATARPDTL